MSENKMTPDFFKTLPWRIASQKWLDCFYFITGKDDNRELKIVEMKDGHHPIKEHRDRIRNNAEAIVSAVNNTYGCGINPEAVGALWSVVDCLIKYEDTITEAGVDLNDYYWFQSAKAAIKLAKLI